MDRRRIAMLGSFNKKLMDGLGSPLEHDTWAERTIDLMDMHFSVDKAEAMLNKDGGRLQPPGPG
jgi:hypothetical protein